MNCRICNQPIRLVPTAEERAKGSYVGQTADYYRKLFTTHATCELEERRKAVSELMARRREEDERKRVVVRTFRVSRSELGKRKTIAS